MNLEEEQAADLERVTKAINDLSEHFDSVQIFCTRYDAGAKEDGTRSVNKGTGNILPDMGRLSNGWNCRTKKAGCCYERTVRNKMGDGHHVNAERMMQIARAFIKTGELPTLDDKALQGITWFYMEVCRRAEHRMMTTGKMEGAHYIAMRELMKELKLSNEKMFQKQMPKTAKGLYGSPKEKSDRQAARRRR